MLLKNIYIGTLMKVLTMFAPFLLFGILDRQLDAKNFALWLLIFQYMRSFQQVDLGTTGVAIRLLTPYRNIGFNFLNVAKTYFKYVLAFLLSFGLLSGLVATFFLLSTPIISIVLYYAAFHLLLTFLLKISPIILGCTNKYYFNDGIITIKGYLSLLMVFIIEPNTWNNVYYVYFVTILICDFIISLKIISMLEFDNNNLKKIKPIELNFLFNAFGVGIIIAASALTQKLFLTYVQSNYLEISMIVTVAIPLMLFNSLNSLSNYPARWSNSLFSKMTNKEFFSFGNKKLTYLVDFIFMNGLIIYLLISSFLDTILNFWLPNLLSEQMIYISIYTSYLIIILSFSNASNLFRNCLQARGKFQFVWIVESTSILIPISVLFIFELYQPIEIISSIVIINILRLISHSIVIKIFLNELTIFKNVSKLIFLVFFLIFLEYYQNVIFEMIILFSIIPLFIFFSIKKQNEIF